VNEISCIPPGPDATGLGFWGEIIGAGIEAGAGFGAAMISADANKYAIDKTTKAQLQVALSKQKAELEAHMATLRAQAEMQKAQAEMQAKMHAATVQQQAAAAQQQARMQAAAAAQQAAVAQVTQRQETRRTEIRTGGVSKIAIPLALIGGTVLSVGVAAVILTRK